MHNLGIDIVHLSDASIWSPACSAFSWRPLVGKASDAFGKFATFAFGCAVSVVMVLIFTHLGHVVLDDRDRRQRSLMFVGIFSRMIAQALIS